MNGIFCKPETLEVALKSEGLYSTLSYLGKGILKNEKLSEEEKLNSLFQNEMGIKDYYDLLKKCMSKEKTIPKKVVDYLTEFFRVGPITLEQAMYAFCNDNNVLREYERQKVVGSYFGEHGLLNLMKDKMNPHEYGFVKKNIRRS